MSDLARIMASTSEEMKANLQKTRAALTHSLSKGEAVEESVRKFLRRHLPTSLGIAKGQVVDSRGGISKQMDVIIYDAARTPVLFTSESEGLHLLPSEGVIAAIEVKTKLTATEVPGLIENMKSIKTLDKSAFLNTDTVIQTNVNMFGEQLPLFPTLYFVFAFESADVNTYLNPLTTALEALPLSQRIDCICLLDRGVFANHTFDPFQLDAAPTPGSQLLPAFTEHSLLMWFLLISNYLLQAQLRPIALNRYVPAGFTY